MEGNFLKHLLGITKKIQTPSVQPSVVPSVPIQKRDVVRPKPIPPRPPEFVPGSFFTFEFYIELKIADVVHFGYPKVPIRDTSTGKVRWGSKVEWMFPDPAQLRIAWIDDEKRGVAHRKFTGIEDVLGAEGKVGDMHLRFERILDAGKNQVVYALYCPEKNIRLAYGFDRTIFDPTAKD